MQHLVEKHGAKDSTARKTMLHELDAMQSRPSQYHPGSEIPERSLAYRLAKKFAYHDYGAYTHTFNPDNWQDPDEADDSVATDLTQVKL